MRSTRITPWEFTLAEFRMMLAFRKVLDVHEACVLMNWSDATWRNYMQRVHLKMGTKNAVAPHVLFDRWCDASADEVDALKRAFAIVDWP